MSRRAWLQPLSKFVLKNRNLARFEPAGTGLSAAQSSTNIQLHPQLKVSYEDLEYLVTLTNRKFLFGSKAGRRKVQSRPVSRVLSRTVIHLGRTSPRASSDLPEPRAGRTNGFLFGLAPGGVCLSHACCQPRGALLPHHFTLTCRPEPTSAVCFLLHFPWARAPQALPGTLPCGARTFLPVHLSRSDCPADSAPAV